MTRKGILRAMSINDMVKSIDESEREGATGWTVWVGGSEVNSNYLSQEKANYLAGYWIGKGYDNVVIEEVSK